MAATARRFRVSSSATPALVSLVMLLQRSIWRSLGVEPTRQARPSRLQVLPSNSLAPLAVAAHPRAFRVGRRDQLFGHRDHHVFEADQAAGAIAGRFRDAGEEVGDAPHRLGALQKCTDAAGVVVVDVQAAALEGCGRRCRSAACRRSAASPSACVSCRPSLKMSPTLSRISS